MTIIAVIIGFVCIFLGLLGCVIPVLPGPPLSYVGILLIHFTDKYEYSTPLLLILLGLVIVVTVLDYLIPMWGSKYLGASKWGTRGSFIGTILGLFFIPWGLIVGPFLGALIGELINNTPTHIALKVAFMSFLAFILTTGIKLIYGIAILIVFITCLF